MSSESVEVIRRGYEAFNRGDLDSAIADMDPQIEWLGPAILPDAPSAYRGHDGVRAFWAIWDEVFEQFWVEIEEMIDAGDQVVAMVRIHGRGRDSGVDVATPSFPHVWTVRDGKQVRMEMMPSRREALAAVGLEQA
jgi:ketosteroid isomerase-like protein